MTCHRGPRSQSFQQQNRWNAQQTDECKQPEIVHVCQQSSLLDRQVIKCEVCLMVQEIRGPSQIEERIDPLGIMLELGIIRIKMRGNDVLMLLGASG